MGSDLSKKSIFEAKIQNITISHITRLTTSIICRDKLIWKHTAYKKDYSK